jgi:hypothetical protein
MFGALMNVIKDAISYDEGENPYVKGTRKKIQRAINSSGLLGQMEKPIDALFPVYPNSSPKFTNSPGGWAMDKVTDVSPVASWAAKPIKAGIAFNEGKPHEGARHLVRAAPFVGSFPVVAGDVAKLFKDK